MNPYQGNSGIASSKEANTIIDEYTNKDHLLPHKVTALPPIKRALIKKKPLPGVSYLSTSGIYDEIMAFKNSF
jgi:hypothetical protein